MSKDKLVKGHARGVIKGPNEEIKKMLLRSVEDVDIGQIEEAVIEFVDYIKLNHEKVTLDEWKKALNDFCLLWRVATMEYSVNGEDSERMMKIFAILDYAMDNAPDVFNNLTILVNGLPIKGLPEILRKLNKENLQRINEVVFDT